MIRHALLIIGLTLFTACEEAGQDLPQGTWMLTELRGETFSAPTTIAFSEGTGISGKAACNRYHAALEGRYPAFTVGPIVATRMACPDLPAESAYFEALGAVTGARMGDGVLILSDGEVTLLAFKPAR